MQKSQISSGSVLISSKFELVFAQTPVPNLGIGFPKHPLKNLEFKICTNHANKLSKISTKEPARKLYINHQG